MSLVAPSCLKPLLWYLPFFGVWTLATKKVLIISTSYKLRNTWACAIISIIQPGVASPLVNNYLEFPSIEQYSVISCTWWGSWFQTIKPAPPSEIPCQYESPTIYYSSVYSICVIWIVQLMIQHISVEIAGGVQCLNARINVSISIWGYVSNSNNSLLSILLWRRRLQAV